MRAFVASIITAAAIAVVAAVAFEQFDWSSATQNRAAATVRLD